MERLHFVGVAGSGMSALAQFHAMEGGVATGSDRNFDRGQASELAAQLKALGVRLFPQDGSAFETPPERVVASTAIEDDNADLLRAKALGIPILHRSEKLSQYVAAHRTIAVAGTSGKSTVAAMIFEILEHARKNPSIITGGALLALKDRGLAGNAFKGSSDLLVVEADESDGTLVGYRPWLGVLLNIDRDHKEISEILPMFRTFRSRCAEFLVHEGSPGMVEFEKGSSLFGKANSMSLAPEGSEFTLEGVRFHLPLPGRHNVDNALAAVAACSIAGVPLPTAAEALSAYRGVARRFEKVAEGCGVLVVDDFAHNPAKVEAAVEAAHLKGGRLLAVFQIHGFAPARFHRQALIETFGRVLEPRDILWMPEIYYAGGTADRGISAREIAGAISAGGRDARFAQDRGKLPEEIARAARPGDVVLIMGARDPSLPALARDIGKAVIHSLSTGG